METRDTHVSCLFRFLFLLWEIETEYTEYSTTHVWERFNTASLLLKIFRELLLGKLGQNTNDFKFTFLKL